MDLDPFEPAGIAESTMRFIDLFLLHCLLHDSPPDSPQEIAALADNQQRTAARGREPGLTLRQDGRDVLLAEWAAGLLAQFAPLAAAMDAAHGGQAYAQALAAAQAAAAAPHTLPSARVLQAISKDFGGSYPRFIRAQSEVSRQRILALPYDNALHRAFQAEADESLQRQAQIECADQGPFEAWRERYLDPQNLEV